VLNKPNLAPSKPRVS